MPIKFKVIERGQPGVVGGGEKKFYANIALDGELTIDDIVQLIEKFSALSEADIRGVIIALENVIQKGFTEGKIIRLEKLGSLYPSLRSKGEDTEAKVTKASIIKVKVNYRPGPRLEKEMSIADFVKITDSGN